MIGGVGCGCGGSLVHGRVELVDGDAVLLLHEGALLALLLAHRLLVLLLLLEQLVVALGRGGQ